MSGPTTEERAQWVKACALGYNFGSHEELSRPYRERIVRLANQADEYEEEIRRTIRVLYRIRNTADHYYEQGNKHRNLKGIRKASTRLLSELSARHPELARAALHSAEEATA